MGDRQEHSPPRDNKNEDQETREFFRAMVTGQEQMAQALQTLTTMVERMNPQDRWNLEQGDSKSAVGSTRAHRTLSKKANMPTRPTYVREEPVQKPIEEVEDETFANILMAANDEWELLAPQVQERMTFERFVNQRREHYRSLRQDRRHGGQNSELKRATGKLTMPTFDGSGKMTAQAWIHNQVIEY